MSTKSVDNFVHRLHKKRENGLTKRVQTVCTNFDQKILVLKIKVLKKTSLEAALIQNGPVAAQRPGAGWGLLA